MFKDQYWEVFSQVTASDETKRRILNMTKKRKPRPHFTIGKILVAAALVCMLAITASAAEDVLHWFTKFFGGPETLSQEQIQYLQENIQEIAADLSGDTKEEANCVHTDVLQFVDEMFLCKADANNTHITKQGEVDNRDIKVYSLTLSEKGAQLEYYYTWEEIPSRPCSISGLTVVFSSGDTRFLPITDSQRRMYFDTEEAIALKEVVAVRLPDGTELTPKNKVDDGYELSVDSVLTDGQTAYIVFNVTLPEEIPSPGEGWRMEEIDIGQNTWFIPAQQETYTMDDIINNHVGVKFIEDTGGSKKMMVSLTMDNADVPFTPGSQWKLHLGGFECEWKNDAKEEEVTSKYAGQDYIIDGEEVESFFKVEPICFDTWDFLLTFDGLESEAVELVSQPVTMEAYRGATIDELRENPDKDMYGPFEIQLTSLTISPLSYYLEYTTDDKNPYSMDPGEFTLVMKDGTEIPLIQYAGQRYRFEKPIILSEASHVQCPNGTKLYMPQ